MRYTALPLFVVAILIGLVAAWTKEDHEIFQLRNEIIAKEGPNVTFYDFLEVKPNANQDDINKAYRKKLKLLHPDKVKRAFIANNAPDKKKRGQHKAPPEHQIANAVKQATERSARLNAVANILRGPLRERYDHFLRHGFPMWKGTGYYYSRFRPGLGAVLVGLFLFSGIVHYVALIISYRRQREFMEKYIRHARKVAWGDERALGGIPGLDANIPAAEMEGEESPAAMALNRRQKRMMERESRKENRKGIKGAGLGDPAASGTSTPVAETVTNASGNKKRVHAENGKILVVDSIGNVFLEEETEDGEKQEFLLDVDEIPRPTIQNTIVFRLPRWLYGKITGGVAGAKDSEESEVIQGSEYVYVHGTDAQVDGDVKASAGTATPTAGTRKRGKRGQRK